VQFCPRESPAHPSFSQRRIVATDTSAAHEPRERGGHRQSGFCSTESIAAIS
jgi:hypothetical protein